jgi:hypothetical protein
VDGRGLPLVFGHVSKIWSLLFLAFKNPKIGENTKQYQTTILGLIQ